MADGNDDARADQQLAVVPDNNDPAPFDQGKADLAAARLAVEEEEAALAAGQPTEPAAAVAPVAPVAAAPTAPAAPPAQIMVPKQRLDEVTARFRTEQAERLRLEGALRVTTAQQAPAAAAAPPVPTLDQLIQAEDAKIEEAATKFDAGEITMVDFKRVERAAGAMISSLRESALFEALVARQPQMGMVDSIFLDRRTAELETANPWLGVISQDGNRMQAFAEVARADLAARGEPIQGDSPMETLRLREAMAELSNTYGPRWYPTLVQPAPAAAAPPGAPANAVVPARPPARQAPAANPVLRAAAHPPNINQMGTPGLSSNDPTDEQIENMSSDQIGALPAATRARLQAR